MAKAATPVKVVPTALKEITVFTDHEGRIFKNVDEYNIHVENERKAKEAEAKRDLIEKIVRCVHPKFRGQNQVQFISSLELSGAAPLQEFLQWLNIHELETIYNMFVRVTVVQPRR